MEDQEKLKMLLQVSRARSLSRSFSPALSLALACSLMLSPGVAARQDFDASHALWIPSFVPQGFCSSIHKPTLSLPVPHIFSIPPSLAKQTHSYL